MLLVTFKCMLFQDGWMSSTSANANPCVILDNPDVSTRSRAHNRHFVVCVSEKETEEKISSWELQSKANWSISDEQESSAAWSGRIFKCGCD